jgi:hypothetical protein
MPYAPSGATGKEEVEKLGDNCNITKRETFPCA